MKEIRVRKLNPLDRCYVAGLLEGEGTFGSYPKDNPRSVRIQCAMVDRDVVEYLAALVGVGNVHPARPRDTLGKQIQWVWTLHTRMDVLDLCSQIYDLMGARRRTQIDKMRATGRQPLTDVV